MRSSVIVIASDLLSTEIFWMNNAADLVVLMQLNFFFGIILQELGAPKEGLYPVMLSSIIYLSFLHLQGIL